jgi:EAL domain-containing protein (putative c-di-GMP-specific phosphodiesterase class I)
MARAEEALSEARRLPSDGHVIYRPSHERDWKRRQNAMHASEIVRCLREDRFLLAFQPVVRRENSATPAYYEALLRIRNASGAIIMAGDLIPVAEQLGLVRLIDRAVVQMAITTLNRYPDAKLAINISGTTAIDPRWSPQITALLAANRGITDRIIIEITETVALSDIQATRLFAEQLRDLGCSVAIDDFGAGFTSFRDLKVLPVDVLKIDGNFCRDLANNSENQYFVRALIDLARAFNFKTVAEWVENEADAALLREWQVDFLQGNLFGAASLDPPWIAAAEEPPIDLTAGELPGGEMDWLPPGERSDHQPAQADADEPAVTAATSEAVPEAAAEIPDMAPEPAIAAFEQELSQELSKLRQAIAALDASFNRRPPPPVSGEPSYADLVSDTVLARAG